VPPEANDRAELAERRGRAAGDPFDDAPRGRVLSAMVEVVTHDGYRSATVDRVLQRANVAWPEFVGLFGDLDSCLLATLDAGMEQAWARASAATREDDALEACFERGLREVLELVAAQPGLARVCLVEASALGARAVERREAGLQRFVDSLERRLEHGEGTGPPSTLAAEMVVGGIHEVVQRKVRAGETAGLPALAGELTRLWLPALRAR
jgi:AcrR family transcriptional regulator